MGRDTCFVGNKRNTINTLVRLIKTRNEWTNFFDNVLSIVSINQDKSHQSMIILDHRSHPFCTSNIPIPERNTRVVYMIICIKQQCFVYIGEAQCIKTFHHHNTGNTSSYPHK